jgi:hypothetical protein
MDFSSKLFHRERVHTSFSQRRRRMMMIEDTGGLQILDDDSVVYVQSLQIFKGEYFLPGHECPNPDHVDGVYGKTVVLDFVDTEGKDHIMSIRADSPIAELLSSEYFIDAIQRARES